MNLFGELALKESGIGYCFVCVATWLLVCSGSSERTWATTPQANPITLRAQMSAPTLPQGANAELIIDVELAAGHRAYAKEFRVENLDAHIDNWQLGKLRIDPTIQFYDKFSKKMKEGVEGSAQLRLSFGVPLKVPEGNYAIPLRLRYQACTEQYCLLPKYENFDVKLSVVPAAAEFKSNSLSPNLALHEMPLNGTATWLKTDTLLSLLTTLSIIFVAGILTSLTPCILPMLPITLKVLGSPITRHGGDQPRFRLSGLMNSLIYVSGIALVYTLLGYFAASSGLVFGSYLGNFWVVHVLALIFIIMGLSQLDWFAIQLPLSIQRRLPSGISTDTSLGKFYSGLLAGVVAGPCVGPVLVAVLTFVAQSKDPGLGALMLWTYAWGLGAIFVIFGSFAGLLRYLPKTGPWMNRTKEIFAAVFFAMAIYYLRPLYPHPFVEIWIGVFGVVFAMHWNMFAGDSDLAGDQRIKKYGAQFVFLASFGLTVIGIKDLVSLADAPVKAPVGNKLFRNFSENELRQAKLRGQPVIVDFYAEWCLACKELDTLTFAAPEVIEYANEFVWLKADVTQESAQVDQWKDTYQIVGLPYVIFFDADGTWRRDLTLTGYENASDFLKRLKQLTPPTPN